MTRKLAGRTSASIALALLLLGPGGVRAQEPPAPAPEAEPEAEPADGPVERWYELVRDGGKHGHARVTWSPSTWQGRPTIHDTTVVVERSVRNMAGVRTTFETTLTIDLERDRDGTLWWQRVVVEEAGRTTTDEVTWTGAGYLSVVQVGDAPARRVEVPLEAPVATDAESFLGPRARAGALAPGDRLTLRLLDVRGRRAREVELTVLEPETLEDQAWAPGPVPCVVVRERDPAAGSETRLWLDREGAFVRLRADGVEQRRVTRAQAEDMPARPPEFSVTMPAVPPLERVFTARRQAVTLHLLPDPTRARPELPATAFSRVVAARGDDAAGWALDLELTAHDDPAAQAAYPLDAAARARFARELEPTPIMPCEHPDLVAAAREAIGDAATVREAAGRLARFVFRAVDKESPDVGELTALEILAQRRGDCSEHAVLFVALCRAAGIPARRCSGLVHIGTLWGNHAWAEVWAGAWIGADPTTGELGTAARYIHYGYQDDPESFPGVASTRIRGRARLVSTALVPAPDELEPGAPEALDLREPATLRVADVAARRWSHRLCGLEVRDLPEGWTVQLQPTSSAALRGPGGASASVSIQADQGSTLEDLGAGANGTFAGHPAFVLEQGERMATVFVHSRRRFVRVLLRGDALARAAVERALAPTFGPPQAVPAEPPPPAEPPAGD